MSLMLRCLAECAALPADVDPASVFAFDDEGFAGEPGALAGVVLRAAGEGRASSLLEAGAATVFLGDAALRDGAVIERLADRFGAGRVGVYVPARRMPVSWSFDVTSNADFRVVTPSQAEPAWEILRADGRGSGVQAHWWLGEMLGRGASAALVQIDLRDDTDLNLCAGLVGAFGERIWLAPPEDAEPALADWIALARIERFALAPVLFARRDSLRAGGVAGVAADAEAG